MNSSGFHVACIGFTYQRSVVFLLIPYADYTFALSLVGGLVSAMAYPPIVGDHTCRLKFELLSILNCLFTYIHLYVYLLVY